MEHFARDFVLIDFGRSKQGQGQCHPHNPTCMGKGCFPRSLAPPARSDGDLVCTGTSDMPVHQDPTNQLSKAQLELQWRAICKLSLADGTYATGCLVRFQDLTEHGPFLLTNSHL